MITDLLLSCETCCSKIKFLLLFVVVGRNKNLLFSVFFRIYEEIQKIEANEFHYQEQVEVLQHRHIQGEMM